MLLRNALKSLQDQELVRRMIEDKKETLKDVPALVKIHAFGVRARKLAFLVVMTDFVIPSFQKSFWRIVRGLKQTIVRLYIYTTQDSKQEWKTTKGKEKNCKLFSHI